jgi:aspartate carbamoyltransferase catalytic subunit
MGFHNSDVISILDFDRSDFDELFTVADEMLKYRKTRLGTLKDKVMATFFFEPSTRTRLGFESAMVRLGGAVIGFADPTTTSVAKGETLGDTTRMGDAFADIIVMRHKCEGAAKFAAELADVPVINGGDGIQHHPTQAMIDLYTINRELGHIDGIHVAMVADIAHARLMTSLCHAFGYYDDIKLSLISPPQLRVRPEVRDYLAANKVTIFESSNLSDVIEDVDVICMSRIMPERFADMTEYERLKGSYAIDRKSLEKAKDSLIILHALPRVDELLPEVDGTTHARYFQQAMYSLPVRMALLSLILGPER